MTSDLTSVGDFRTIVARVSDQLTSLCQKWRQEISSDAKLTVHLISDDVLGDINVAIGQAELLKKERFKQFVGLIDACEFKRGEKETTIQDLQGFWDIIYFQVDDILQKFSALQKLKANKWIEIPKNVAKPVPSKNNLVKSRPPTGKIRTASSLSLKAHIMAARSRMNQLSLSSQKKSKDLLIPEINTFDAGFFKVLSSSLLKERIKRTPVTHKDYSPCMRITRSMKKMRFASAQKLYSEFF
ncbi:hypothetical protein HAZT_HAZT012022 [Hyalella azteca]|uniref:Uncharacterized protein n=1 Tax=Hyalella azteca TaxID=294128 RepID=A0A6A0H6H1_HYAAZ|nr:hypothetical protein HAZT_HAZT012022 [Hyalella azteca]